MAGDGSIACGDAFAAAACGEWLSIASGSGFDYQERLESKDVSSSAMQKVKLGIPIPRAHSISNGPR